MRPGRRFVLGVAAALTVAGASAVEPSRAEGPAARLRGQVGAPPPDLAIVGQVGGASHAVAVQGTHAYLGLGPRLVVYDVRDPRVPDYPTYQEIAVEARGESVKQSVEYRAMTAIVQLGTMLLAVVYPPGVDQSLVETMRQAMSDTLADPEYRDAFEKQLGFPYELIPGAEAQSLAERIVKDASEDQEALEYLRRLSREKQG